MIDDEPAGVTMVEDIVEQTFGIRLCKSFDNAFDALIFFQTNGPVDVIFLDIDMPFINGIEAAKLLNPYCTFLIFVTAHREYGPEAFEVNADGYLLKPLMKSRFLELMDKLRRSKIEKANSQKDNRYLLVKGSLKNTYTNIWAEGILYIKAMANYIQIFLSGAVKTTQMGLNAIEKALEGNPAFLKINRSTIIAVDKISTIDGYSVIMNDQAAFTVGRKYRNAFNEFVMKKALNP
ncbi:response regulator transcription factor [Pedobacter aquatilis]|uniref:LytR/AlgR family response regulator transcription factor n=1 Tax=Pedobacter aquatilis TaxID=351343 RepID=UPI0029314B8F|nr:response regulator transcription factor [Pedobacter aquatilis]